MAVFRAFAPLISALQYQLAVLSSEAICTWRDILNSWGGGQESRTAELLNDVQVAFTAQNVPAVRVMFASQVRLPVSNKLSLRNCLP